MKISLLYLLIFTAFTQPLQLLSQEDAAEKDSIEVLLDEEDIYDENGELDEEKIDSILMEQMGISGEEYEEEKTPPTPVVAAPHPGEQGTIGDNLEEKYGDALGFRLKEKETEKKKNTMKIEPLADLFQSIARTIYKVVRFLINDPLGNVIGLFMLAGLIYFITYLLRKNKAKVITANEEEVEPELMTDEELIRKADLRQLLQEAEKKGQHKNALRYYYLILIKKMDEFSFIRWSPSLTNGAILRQIKNSDLKNSFAELTRAYEYIWFGGYDLPQQEYARLKEVLVQATQTTEVERI